MIQQCPTCDTYYTTQEDCPVCAETPKIAPVSVSSIPLGNSGSVLEVRFIRHWQLLAKDYPQPECEYRFHPTRKWRFDFAWVNSKVAVEMEGGLWSYGRHNRAQGYIDDLEKYNAAVILGWRVLRYHQVTVTQIEQIKKLLDSVASEAA